MQRQPAINKILVAGMETIEQIEGWNLRELAILPPVAGLTGQHQVPDAVEVHAWHLLLGNQRDKVIYIGQQRMPGLQTYRRIAVEAVPLLIAVQAVAAAGERDAIAVELGEEGFTSSVVMYVQQLRRQIHLPGLLNQPPAGVGFMHQVVELLGLGQAVELIRQTDALVLPTFVDEELLLQRPAVDIVEGIQHYREAIANRHSVQLILVNLTEVVLQAGGNQLAGFFVVEDLPGGIFQVLADVPAERHGQIVELNQGVAAIDIIQGMGQGELVGGKVVAKEDHAAPVILQRGIDLIEAHACILISVDGVTPGGNRIK